MSEYFTFSFSFNIFFNSAAKCTFYEQTLWADLASVQAWYQHQSDHSDHMQTALTTGLKSPNRSWMLPQKTTFRGGLWTRGHIAVNAWVQHNLKSNKGCHHVQDPLTYCSFTIFLQKLLWDLCTYIRIYDPILLLLNKDFLQFSFNSSTFNPLNGFYSKNHWLFYEVTTVFTFYIHNAAAFLFLTILELPFALLVFQWSKQLMSSIVDWLFICSDASLCLQFHLLLPFSSLFFVDGLNALV